MKIKYQGYKRLKEQTRELWTRIATDYNSGMSASEITKRYKNPRTGKNYTRTYIYYILKQVQIEGLLKNN